MISFLCHLGLNSELLAFHRKKKKSKKKTESSGSDESDAEEQVVWMEKKSMSASLVVSCSCQFSTVG